MMNKRVVIFSILWCFVGGADSSAATVATRLSAGARQAMQGLSQAAAKGAKSAVQAVKKDPLRAVGATGVGMVGVGGAIGYHDYQAAKAEQVRKQKEWEDENVLTGDSYALFLKNNQLQAVQKQNENRGQRLNNVIRTTRSLVDEKEKNEARARQWKLTAKAKKAAGKIKADEIRKQLEEERAQWFFIRAARNFFPTINQAYYDLTMALTAAKKAMVARAKIVGEVTVAKVSAAAAALEYALNPSGMAYDVGKGAWKMSAQKATSIGTAVGNRLSTFSLRGTPSKNL